MLLRLLLLDHQYHPYRLTGRKRTNLLSVKEGRIQENEMIANQNATDNEKKNIHNDSRSRPDHLLFLYY